MLFARRIDLAPPPSAASLDVHQIADQRRAISALGVGLAPSRNESTSEVVRHAVSVSLGIVGRNGWGLRPTRPSLDRAILCEVDHDGISSQSRVRFRSGRLWRPERHGASLLPWSLLFYFCQLMPHVIWLVFLLVSVDIDNENDLKFKWLWL
jgi:hypothetical protein